MGTKEPQYNMQVEEANEKGLAKLGLTTSHTYRNDPRRLLFLLSRYKFVSKMFSNYENILEAGCGDGFGTQIISQECKNIDAIDFDEIFIENCKKNRDNPNVNFYLHDILDTPFKQNYYNGIYSLDVLEHIPKEKESIYLINLVKSLKYNGSLIIGMPSLESQEYASIQSKQGHINCKSGNELKTLLEEYFHNVFLFSMNDEVVHTGYSKMAHYILVLCTYKKENK